MVTQEIAPLRRRLADRLATLTRVEKRIERHLRGDDGRFDEDGDDFTTMTANDVVLDRLDEVTRSEIADVGDALSRIERGAYGACEACGDAIEPRRLTALPEARRCRTCEVEDVRPQG